MQTLIFFLRVTGRQKHIRKHGGKITSSTRPLGETLHFAMFFLQLGYFTVFCFFFFIKCAMDKSFKGNLVFSLLFKHIQ